MLTRIWKEQIKFLSFNDFPGNILELFLISVVDNTKIIKCKPKLIMWLLVKKENLN